MPQLYQQELLSDDIQEVISYRPRWVVRKGNIIFLLIILLLLALTWFIRYPDTINASARIVALNPPKLISSKAEGKLLKLFVRNEQPVHKNEHLGYIESTSDYYQVVKLQNWINETITATQNNTYSILNNNHLPALTDLGELQTPYQAFQGNMTEIIQTLANGYYQKKNTALQKDLQDLANLENNAYEQKKLLEQDHDLQNKEYKAYELLEKEKVIAPLELDRYKSKLIATNQSIKQADAQITNGEISSRDKRKELLDLQKLITDQKQLFHSSLFELKSQIEKWLQQYVLVASEDGEVIFISALQENELIGNGQELFYIQPTQTQFYAEVRASQKGLGKIGIGQKVIIKVESYPSNEFGSLRGTINYISKISNHNDSFLIRVDLPGGLETNYNKTIFFRNNLSALAEIITDNRRLFERLTGKLKRVGN